MSTILKALKHSEASRPRDSSLPPGQVPARRSVRHRRPALWWSTAGVLLAGAAAAAWWLLDTAPVDRRDSRAGPRGIAEVSLPARPPAPAEGIPEADRGERTAPAESVTDGPAPPGASSEGQTAATGENRPRAGEDETAADPQDSPVADPDVSAAPGPEPEPDADTSRPAGTADRQLEPFALLPRLKDLPPARRDGLPRLALNAHVHAAEPAQRFVLINLARYGEGDHVAPGLTVAAIFPGGVVLEDGQGRFVLPRP